MPMIDDVVVVQAASCCNRLVDGSEDSGGFRAKLRLHFHGAMCSASLRFKEIGHVGRLRGRLGFAESDGFERLGIDARAPIVGFYALLEEIHEVLAAGFIAEALASERQESPEIHARGGGKDLLHFGNVGLDKLERRRARFTLAERAEQQPECSRGSTEGSSST